MPTYDYRCNACGVRFELFQSMTEAHKKKCPTCGKNKLERLIGPGAGFIFKGAGFYETDYRSSSYEEGAKAEASSSASDAPSKEAAKSDSKSESTAASKKDAPKGEPSAESAPKKGTSAARPAPSSKPSSKPTSKPSRATNKGPSSKRGPSKR